MLEYVIPAGLMAVGLIAALTVFSSDIVPRMVMGPLKGTLDGGKLTVKPLGQFSATKRSSGAATKTPGTQMTVKLDNRPDIQLNVPYSVATMAEIIETNGVNGATIMLADEFTRVIQELEAMGELDNDLMNELLALSKKGYELAAIESVMEEALAQSGGDPDKYMNTKVSYLGKEYVMSDFMATYQVGYHADHSEVQGNPFDSRLRPKGATAEFLDMYYDLEASGQLKNPNVERVVQGLSGEILYLSDVPETSNWLMNNGKPDKAVTLNDRIDVSGMTQENADNICTLGVSDPGANCP